MANKGCPEYTPASVYKRDMVEVAIVGWIIVIHDVVVIRA